MWRLFHFTHLTITVLGPCLLIIIIIKQWIQSFSVLISLLVGAKSGSRGQQIPKSTAFMRAGSHVLTDAACWRSDTASHAVGHSKPKPQSELGITNEQVAQMRMSRLRAITLSVSCWEKQRRYCCVENVQVSAWFVEAETDRRLRILRSNAPWRLAQGARRRVSSVHVSDAQGRRRQARPEAS